MTTRRDALIGLAASALQPHGRGEHTAYAPPERCAAVFEAAPARAEGRLRPLREGDILIGATRLDRQEDPYAGRGRLLQLDEDLRPVSVLWTAGTTHQLVSLAVDPAGLLWAFDPIRHVVVHVGPDGWQRPLTRFGDRPYGSVAFARDGRVFLGEALRGFRASLERCLRFAAGGASFGDGRIDVFDRSWHAAGTLPDALIREAITALAAVSFLSAHPSEPVLAYAMRGGKHVYRYDLARARPLADLVTFRGSVGSTPAIAAMSYADDGRLLLIRDAWLEVRDPRGALERQWALAPLAWSAVAPMRDREHCLLAESSGGTVLKVELRSGRIVARFPGLGEEPRRAATGVTEYRRD